MAFSDIPIRIKESYQGGSNANFDANDLAQYSPTQEQILSYLAGKEILSYSPTNTTDNYTGYIGNGALGSLNTSANRSSIGNYIDTRYGQSDGTHPSSNISITTTTTDLFTRNPLFSSISSANNKLGSSGLPESGFKWPVIFDADLKSMRLPTFAETESFSDRINSYIATNTWPGTYYLGTSAPSDGDTWAVHQSSVFSDTLNTLAATNYNLYVKTDLASPPTTDANNRAIFSWMGNTESYDTDTTDVRNHGLNETIAMVTTTGVRYSAIYPNTVITEKQTDGTTSTLVTTSSTEPARGAH